MKIMSDFQGKPAAVFAIGIIIVCSVIAVMIAFILIKKIRRSMEKSGKGLKKIANCSGAGLVQFILEDKCRIVYASHGFYEMLGYEKKSSRIRNRESLLDYVAARELVLFIDTDRILLDEGKIRQEICLDTADEKNLYALMNGNYTEGRDGKHVVSAVFIDISDQKKMQETILLESERYRIATELSNDIIFEYNIETDEMIYTNKYMDLFGRNPVISGYISGCEKYREFIIPDDWGVYLLFCKKLHKGENMIETKLRMKNRLGQFIWCQAMGKTIYDDKIPLRVVGKIINIDNNKKELDFLEYKATRDPLTNVYNREAARKKIVQFIKGNYNKKHMLIFFDFDDFKKVNDNYGHLIGDKVLLYAISRIQQVSTEGEIIARIGGDEFIVFAGNINTSEEIVRKVIDVKNALETTYITENGRAISISGSIGIALYPKDGLYYEQLMDRADHALYSIKEHGKNNYMFYSSVECKTAHSR
jgi:diguanylate cyclase (GGDEF)-like protein